MQNKDLLFHCDVWAYCAVIYSKRVDDEENMKVLVRSPELGGQEQGDFQEGPTGVFLESTSLLMMLCMDKNGPG